MITKFNTITPAGSASSSSSASGSNNVVRNVLIVGAIAVAGYFLYRYFNRKNQETTVYIDESEEY
jgi:hypothetical protein